MASLLTSVGDKKDTMSLYLAECRRMGIKVLPPDVNSSAQHFTPAGADIRFGLGAVRNVGENVVDAVVRCRKSKSPYTSFSDFLDKVELVVCNKRTVESLIKAGSFDSLGHSRRALVEAHERAVDSVIDLKKQEALGQDSLFGELAADEPEAAAFGGVTIPADAPEWPKKILLNYEREMLGLYVSSHPLEGAEPLLSRNRDCSIPELLDSGRTEGEVRVAGIISKVDRRINKAGNPWAMVTVEDLDAAVDVMFFASAYQLCSPELIPDAAVAVKGRLNERDGAITLFGSELTPLDISSADKSTPVVLQIPERRLTPQAVAELKRVLEIHPGGQPVHLNVITHEAIVRYTLPAYPVDTGNGFFSELKGLFGPSVLAA
jgi:DNA polymerase-3 subunit alpha